MSNEYLVVLVTAPPDQGEVALARALVTEGLAACVNMVPGVRSVYQWEGQLQDDQEVLLVIKTRASRYEALQARVKELHPYEVPEIIALPIQRGQPDYLAWLTAGTQEPG